MANISLGGIRVGYSTFGDEPGDGQLICFNCAVKAAIEGNKIQAETLDPDNFTPDCSNCGGYHIG